MRCGSHHALVNCCAPPANLLTLTPLSLLPFSFCVSQPSSTLSSLVFSLIFQVSFLTLFFSSAPHTLLKVPVFSLFQSSLKKSLDETSGQSCLFVIGLLDTGMNSGDTSRFACCTIQKKGSGCEAADAAPIYQLASSLFFCLSSLSLSLSLSLQGSHLT